MPEIDYRKRVLFLRQNFLSDPEVQALPAESRNRIASAFLFGPTQDIGIGEAARRGAVRGLTFGVREPEVQGEARPETPIGGGGIFNYLPPMDPHNLAAAAAEIGSEFATFLPALLGTGGGAAGANIAARTLGRPLVQFLANPALKVAELAARPIGRLAGKAVPALARPVVEAAATGAGIMGLGPFTSKITAEPVLGLLPESVLGPPPAEGQRVQTALHGLPVGAALGTGFALLPYAVLAFTKLRGRIPSGNAEIEKAFAEDPKLVEEVRKQQASPGRPLLESPPTERLQFEVGPEGQAALGVRRPAPIDLTPEMIPRPEGPLGYTPFALRGQIVPPPDFPRARPELGPAARSAEVFEAARAEAGTPKGRELLARKLKVEQARAERQSVAAERNIREVFLGEDASAPSAEQITYLQVLAAEGAPVSDSFKATAREALERWAPRAVEPPPVVAPTQRGEIAPTLPQPRPAGQRRAVPAERIESVLTAIRGPDKRGGIYVSRKDWGSWAEVRRRFPTLVRRLETARAKGQSVSAWDELARDLRDAGLIAEDTLDALQDALLLPKSRKLPTLAESEAADLLHAAGTETDISFLYGMVRNPDLPKDVRIAAGERLRELGESVTVSPEPAKVVLPEPVRIGGKEVAPEEMAKFSPEARAKILGKTSPDIALTKQAVPSRPTFSAELYRGQGATLEQIYGKEAVTEGRAYPILGKAAYYAETRQAAQRYGKVAKETVELGNPLTIDSDAQWVQLVQDANTPHLSSVNPEFYKEPKRIPEMAERMQRYLKGRGYDGVIIKVPEEADINVRGERTKRLAETFGESQVVKFADVAPAKIPGVSEKPKEQEAAEEMRGMLGGEKPRVEPTEARMQGVLAEAASMAETQIRNLEREGFAGEAARARTRLEAVKGNRQELLFLVEELNGRVNEIYANRAPRAPFQLEAEQAKTAKAKPVQQGLLGEETPQAKTPEGALEAKVAQTEAPLPLEAPTLPETPELFGAGKVAAPPAPEILKTPEGQAGVSAILGSQKGAVEIGGVDLGESLDALFKRTGLRPTDGVRENLKSTDIGNWAKKLLTPIFAAERHPQIKRAWDLIWSEYGHADWKMQQAYDLGRVYFETPYKSRLKIHQVREVEKRTSAEFDDAELARRGLTPQEVAGHRSFRGMMDGLFEDLSVELRRLGMSEAAVAEMLNYRIGYQPESRNQKAKYVLWSTNEAQPFFRTYQTAYGARADAHQLVGSGQFQPADLLIDTFKKFAPGDFKGIDLGTIEIMARVAEIEPGTRDAFIDAIRDTVQRSGFRSVFRRFQETPGSTPEQVIANVPRYVQNMYRYIARLRLKPQIDEIVGQTGDANARGYVRDLFDWTIMPNPAGATARNIIFLWHLGGVPRGFLVNLSSVAHASIPDLSRFTGLARATELQAGAMKDVLGEFAVRPAQWFHPTARARGITAEEASGLARAESERVVGVSPTTDFLTGQRAEVPRGPIDVTSVGGASESFGKIVDKFTDAASIFMSISEKINRRRDFLAYHRAGHEMGFSGEDLYNFAATGTNRVNSVQSRLNLPPVLRSGPKATAMALRGFTYNQLQLMGEMIRRAARGGTLPSGEREHNIGALMAFLGTNIALGGLQALPLALGSSWAYRRLTGRTAESDFRSWMERMFGDSVATQKAATATMRGVPNIIPAGYGVDLSGSFSLDILGTRPDLEELVLGAGGAIVKGLPAVANQVWRGQRIGGEEGALRGLRRGAEMYGPRVVREAMRFMPGSEFERRGYAQGRSTLIPPGDVTPQQRQLSALGFRPAGVSVGAEGATYALAREQFAREAKRDVLDELADAIQDREPERIGTAVRRAAQEMPEILTNTDTMMRAVMMRLARRQTGQPLLMDVSPALRGDVAEVQRRLQLAR